MPYDYSKLKGLIKEYCGTNAKYAKRLGISNTSLSQRLNNNLPFTQDEIYKSKQILKMVDEDVTPVFFTEK